MTIVLTHAGRSGSRSPVEETMSHRDPILLLALCRMSFLRPRERIKAANALAPTGRPGLPGLAELEAIVGRRFRTAGYCPGELLGRAEADAASLTRQGIGCIFYGDGSYPRALHDIYDPPLALFYRGALPTGEAVAVGVVGTRRPTESARKAAREVGEVLGRAGVCVVSGLARGIDGDAHRGAVEAGGRHVAVLGCGLARIQPASNAAVGRRILALGGTLLSEHAPDEPPRKHHFPARNRLISGLSRAVVVVQAPARSGALITADFALEQGKDVMVHEAGLGGWAGAGGEALAESGARVVSCGAEVLAEMGIHVPPVAPDRDGGSVGARIARALERELEELS